ncbi:MAG TPA: hypothetical protein VL262_18490 [Vicinamibacterales bacterium]|jgi:hypothetical protein|nr:hypothetical protein [Vicinamibacterales bacterium]
MIRSHLLGVVLSVLALSAAVPAFAQQAPGVTDPWFGRMSKPKDMDPPKTFANTFSIELPKDWQLAPGHTNTIFEVTEKTKRFLVGATIVLEYSQLQAAVDPSLLPTVGQVQLSELQKRELSGSKFTQQIKSAEGRQAIVIQYDRPGLSGGTDHVVQYSFPVGTTMYYLICISSADQIEKYRPVFAHAAASFTPLKK